MTLLIENWERERERSETGCFLFLSPNWSNVPVWVCEPRAAESWDLWTTLFSPHTRRAATGCLRMSPEETAAPEHSWSLNYERLPNSRESGSAGKLGVYLSNVLRTTEVRVPTNRLKYSNVNFSLTILPYERERIFSRHTQWMI